MRRVVLLVVLLSLSMSPQVRAQSAPNDPQVVVDRNLILDPGASVSHCFDAPYMTKMTVSAWAPEGRTGETATLLFREDLAVNKPWIYLFAPLAPDPLTATYPAGAGTYCYTVMVSHTLTNPLDATDPNRPEKPYKQVRLKITTDADLSDHQH